MVTFPGTVWEWEIIVLLNPIQNPICGTPISSQPTISASSSSIIYLIMALGVLSLSLFKPFIPSPSVARRAPCLPLHRNTSQTNSITATRAGYHMKLLCPINALFLKDVVNCIMDRPFHIWLNLISEVNDKVMYGYWMSPDLEDGWGFVVAAVDQLYSV